MAILSVAGVFALLLLAACVRFYGWRYVWLYFLPATTRRRLIARLGLDDDAGPAGNSDWNLICRAAPKLTEQYGRAAGVVVSAARRRRLSGVTEGLSVDDLREEIWEPVRERRWFSRRWRQIQSVPEAASAIGTALRISASPPRNDG